MSEPYDDEALVRSAFSDLRVSVPSPPPRRLAAVWATVQRRRRRRAAALVTAATLATALAVTPAVLARGDAGGTPAVAPTGSTATPAPTPPSAPPLGTCPSDPSRAGVDLAVTATDLTLGPVHGEGAASRRRGDMVVTVCGAGAAPAPAGTLTLRWLAVITPDTAMGTESWVGCRAGEPVGAYSVALCDYPALPAGSSWERMFLFEMPGGADPLFGQPLAQFARTGASGDVKPANDQAAFGTEEADPDGTVSGPTLPSCRAGTGRDGVDLAVVSTPLTLGPRPVAGETRRGDILVTVCNNGRAAAPAGTLTLRWLDTIPPDDELGTGSWRGCRSGEPERDTGRGGEVTYRVAHCDYGPLEPGASREHMFLFEIPAGAHPGIDRPVRQYARVPAAGDARPGDNQVTFTIATV